MLKEPIKTHNFILGPCDTDSISFCKPDFSEFTEEEQQTLIDEINAQMPGFIKYAHDGYFKSAIVLKAKNYCLFDGKKKKIKGSAFKSSSKEPVFKEFMDTFVQLLLDSATTEQLLSLYQTYVKKVLNITDIKDFCSKKTVTEKVLKPERTNEQKVLNAIIGKGYTIGDKVYLYFDVNDVLKERSDWKNDHNEKKLLERLFKTVKIFENVIDIPKFINYSLKKNKGLLNEFR